MMGEFHQEGHRRVRECFSPSLLPCDVDHRRDTDEGCRRPGTGSSPSPLAWSSLPHWGLWEPGAAHGLPPCLVERVHELLSLGISL